MDNGKRGNEQAILTLAKNVKKYRALADMSIRDLATAALVSPSQIQRIEAGDINTSVSTIFTLAKALGVTAAQLLEE